MRTWYDYDLKKWVSNKPIKYYSGLKCSFTGEMIFRGDLFLVLNARGHDKPVKREMSDGIATQTGTYIYRKYFKIKKLNN